MAFIKSCSIDSRNEQSPTCEVVHERKHISEIFWSTHTRLAQLVEHYSDDQETMGVKWCMKQTKLTSEISCPTDSCFAQIDTGNGAGSTSVLIWDRSRNTDYGALSSTYPKVKSGSMCYHPSHPLMEIRKVTRYLLVLNSALT